MGGYTDDKEADDTAQFDVSDNRTLSEVTEWLLDTGHIPSFCTACYREGRTGDRFMSLVKSGQIANCCGPNAIITLKEFMTDYGTTSLREKGEALIRRELESITNPKVKETTMRYLARIEQGERDFRF